MGCTQAVPYPLKRLGGNARAGAFESALNEVWWHRTTYTRSLSRSYLHPSSAATFNRRYLLRVRADRYSDVYQPTLESNYTITTHHRDGNVTLKLKEVGATCHGLAPRVTAGVDGYFLLFALDSRSSFAAAQCIHDTLSSLVGNAVSVPRILVGTRSEIPESDRQVTQAEAAAQAAAWRCPYIEVSAATGANVTAAFERMLDEIGTLNAIGGGKLLSTRSWRRRLHPLSTHHASREAGNGSGAGGSGCSCLVRVLTCGLLGGPASPTASQAGGRSGGGLSISVPLSGNELRTPLLFPQSARSGHTHPDNHTHDEFEAATPELLPSPSMTEGVSARGLRRQTSLPSPMMGGIRMGVGAGSGLTSDSPQHTTAPYRGMEVGSVRTGIQLAPYPLSPYGAQQLFFVPTPRGPAPGGITYAGFGATGRHVSADVHGQQLIDGYVAAGSESGLEDGSTGGTPHFDQTNDMHEAVTQMHNTNAVGAVTHTPLMAGYTPDGFPHYVPLHMRSPRLSGGYSSPGQVYVMSAPGTGNSVGYSPLSPVHALGSLSAADRSSGGSMGAAHLAAAHTTMYALPGTGGASGSPSHSSTLPPSPPRKVAPGGGGTPHSPIFLPGGMVASRPQGFLRAPQPGALLLGPAYTLAPTTGTGQFFAHPQQAPLYFSTVPHQ